MSCLFLYFSCSFSWVSSFPCAAECHSMSRDLACTQQGAWQPASGCDRACISLQVEGENDEQPSTDQASAVKTKNVFIAQNVASLQELGRSLSTVRKLVCTDVYQNILAVLLPSGGEPGSRQRPVGQCAFLLIQVAPRSCSECA